MKFLIVLAVILLVLWLVKSAERSRGAPSGPGPARRRPPLPPQDMVQCPVCAVHLPRTDALPGPGGRLYCCAEHGARAAH